MQDNQIPGTGLLPEEFRQALGELADHKRPDPRIEARLENAYSGPRNVLPARPRGGRWNNHLRPVLIPGKRKAARHPWADRLHAARVAGVSLDQTHPGAGVLTLSCYGCGDRVDHNVGDGKSKADVKAELKFRAIVTHHTSRQCMVEATA